MIAKTIIASALLAAITTGSYAKQIKLEVSGDKNGSVEWSADHPTQYVVNCDYAEDICATITFTVADMQVNPQVGDPVKFDVYENGNVVFTKQGTYLDHNVEQLDTHRQVTLNMK